MQKKSEKEIKEKLKNIRLIVSDVDGVLTDGKIYFDAEGKEIKSFHTKDSFRTTIWLKSGNKMLWFTGRKSQGTITRAKELEADLIFKADIKTDLFEYIKETYALNPEQVLYVGDDWNDLHYMQNVGLSATPINAQEENKKIADIVTGTKGGEGVLAEVIETLMRAQDTWDSAVSQYLNKFIL